jgi:excisionase family DNA binding protein
MEEKKYFTYEEAMEYLGCKRSTLYTLVSDLNITTHKFKRDKRRYLALADVKKMKRIRENPWLEVEGEDGPAIPDDLVA